MATQIIADHLEAARAKALDHAGCEITAIAQTLKAVSVATLRTSLNELDCSAQNLATEVAAICKAAQLALLSRDPGAAKAVYTMLGVISAAVRLHEDYVNAEAEANGCNWVDEDERAIMRVLDSVQRGSAAEAAHG